MVERLRRKVSNTRTAGQPAP